MIFCGLFLHFWIEIDAPPSEARYVETPIPRSALVRRARLVREVCANCGRQRERPGYYSEAVVPKPTGGK